MDYATKLEQLEHLRTLVDQYIPMMYTSSDEHERTYREICEVYGQVADVFQEVLSQHSIEVSPAGHHGPATVYPNLFEAGFLSGRTMHTHQGRTELLKVIGKVRALIAKSAQGAQVERPRGNRVFLVHGRNEAVLQSCARFIERLGLPLTVLREQPNQGRTIIEKFIDYADAGFAVVLLTGDDRGGLTETPPEQQRPRARQNVLFELGFFVGKLGRNRVCALYEEGVEIPSDYAGVAFVPLDPGKAWHTELAKEMKAAGLPVDLNKLA
jgi:predicted nucleotide-binding protein